MIQFLKESTFAVNDVLSKSINILKGHYFSIGGLLLSIFLLFVIAHELTFYLEMSSFLVKIPLMLLFAISLLGLQLFLFKYILNLLDHKEHVGFVQTWPSWTELASFLGGIVLFTLASILILVFSMIVCFPLIYMGIDTEVVSFEIVPNVGAVLSFFILLRISFFPFFIIDKGTNVTKSLRWSLAITKGNVIRLFLILLSLAFVSVLNIYWVYMDYSIMAIIFSLINSFLIIPLTSVVYTVAYRDMVQEYKGSEDPEILSNIF
ncbi:beta-carotene 15,15'-monooxygenase [Sphingobacterium sp. SRCM116780]|uniref:beta-carotene 15,15'-monooxygenase n=1 Tax=Sphingobacterium sp. SRCM116780 TaxID=2907623 RepID=UPI001F4668E3|nr:beta-carotene 15,15'-monooxygenase [Sphingobacterium sp. SRCM116780]UIR57223.1 beta-carotene 15,15'-monooxygenase [Sphingobacterium sp. SRCM116780]